MKLGILATLISFSVVACTACAAPPGRNIAVYHIGNSLTRGLSVRRLAALFAASGGRYDHGTQLGGGKKLYEHLANRTADGKPFKRNNIQTKKYGDWVDAFQKHTFDAVVLQPSGAWLTDRDPDNEIVTGDVEAACGFIAYATGANPAKNVATERFYIYGGWTAFTYMLQRKDLDADKDGAVSFSEFWDAPYDGNSKEWVVRVVPNRDFLSKLIAEINERNPDLKHPVLLIPVGEVFAALDVKIRAGRLPGLKQHLTRTTKLVIDGKEYPSNFDYYRASRRGKPNARRRHLAGTALDPYVDTYTGYVQSAGVFNIYADRVHVNAMPHNGPADGAVGGYIASLTFYTVLTGQSPVGLTAKPWERLDPVADAELVKAIQETVWEVVSTHPLTGLAKPAATKPAAAASASK